MLKGDALRRVCGEAAALENLSAFWDGLFPADRNRLLRRMVCKATISPTELRVTLDLTEIGIVADELTSGATPGRTPGTFEAVEAIRMAYVSGRRRVMSAADETLDDGRVQILAAVAHARRWRKELVSGRAASGRELADALGLEPSFFTKRLSLASLAPELLRRLLDGAGLGDVSIQRLQEIATLPWPDQCAAMGIA